MGTSEGFCPHCVQCHPHVYLHGLYIIFSLSIPLYPLWTRLISLFFTFFTQWDNKPNHFSFVFSRCLSSWSLHSVPQKKWPSYKSTRRRRRNSSRSSRSTKRKPKRHEMSKSLKGDGREFWWEVHIGLPYVVYRLLNGGTSAHLLFSQTKGTSLRTDKIIGLLPTFYLV